MKAERGEPVAGENTVKTDSKNVVWNIIGTSLNALISLMLMVIVTRVNGEDSAGVYAYAFSVSLVFYFIGVYYGRVYQVSDTSDCTDGDYLITKACTCLCMIVVSLGFVFFNNYDGYKNGCILLFCTYKCVEAFTECIYGIIQRKDELYKVGISFSIKSILVVGSFWFIDLLTHNLLLSATSIIVSYLIVFLVYDVRNVKQIDTDLSSRRLRRICIYRNGFYPFAISILSAYLINASKYAINYRLTNVDQTIYGILIMPSTVILLFVQYILQPYINKISYLYENGVYSEIRKTVKKFMIAIGIVSLVGVTVSATIGIPILEIIYGVYLHDYRLHLIIIMIGAGMFGIANILSYILITMRKNRAQTVMLLISSVAAWALSDRLTAGYELLGATLSYTSVMGLIFSAFTIFTFMYLKEKKVEDRCRSDIY